MSLLHWILKKRLLRKWRRTRHKSTIRLKVSDVPGLLGDMDENGIRYVVLRWPEEVPITTEQKWPSDKDVDILADIEKKMLPVMADIASRRPGPVPCDLYSISGRAGTSYLGKPYYPPVLAEDILKNRCRHSMGFYVPQPLWAFRSLAFHLAYHKGVLSGIPTGCEIQTEPHPKRDYKQRIEELGKSLNIEIEPPYSLLKLHDYLKQHQWNMPYDLLERYPRRDPWHEYLLRRELDLLRPWAQRLPGLLVFFIRQDATSPEKLDFITSRLSDKFQIVLKVTLSEDQINRVIRLVRGGNWVQGPDLELVRPVIAMITYDHNPVPVDESDQMKKITYPLVRNGNVFVKQQIREMLNSKFSTDGEIFGIHGSDNEFEAQHMLRAIYDRHIDEANNKLAAGLKKP